MISLGGVEYPRERGHNLTALDHFITAELGLYVRLERAGDGGGKLHVWISRKSALRLTAVPEGTVIAEATLP
jgi:hypothetical protein